MIVVEFLATVAKKRIEIDLICVPKYSHVMLLVPDLCDGIKTTSAIQFYIIVLILTLIT